MLSGEDGPKGHKKSAQGSALGIRWWPMYAPPGQKNWSSSSGKMLLLL